MHTTTQRYTISEERLNLYENLKKGNNKILTNNYTLWQKIYYMCSTLPDPVAEYNDTQSAQVRINAELVDQENSHINKYNCQGFTPVNFLFNFKNTLEINLHGVVLERNLCFGEGFYLQACDKLPDLNTMQKFKTPTLIKTADDKLYVYGQGSTGKTTCACIGVIFEELKEQFNQGKTSMREAYVSAFAWGKFWDKITAYHMPYKQEYNSGRSYVNISHQANLAQLLNKLNSDEIQISSALFSNRVGIVKIGDQDGYLKQCSDIKLLDAILRVKEVQNGSLDLFDEKDITNRSLLEKAFKQITMCGGFAAYTMEELYCWHKHLEDVTQKLVRDIMGGEGEPNRELWKEVLSKHNKCNYLEAYDQIIATLDKMKKQIEFAMYLSKQKHKQNLTNKYPVIIALLKKLHAKKVLSQARFEQILEKAKGGLDTGFAPFFSENKVKGKYGDHVNKAPRLGLHVINLRKIFCGEKKSERWENFAANVTGIFTSKINHEAERKKLREIINSKLKALLPKIRNLMFDINSIESEIAKKKEALQQLQELMKEYKKLRQNMHSFKEPHENNMEYQKCLQDKNNLVIKIKNLRKLRLKESILYLEKALASNQVKWQKFREEKYYYNAFKSWLTGPYSNKQLIESTPNKVSESYSESVHYDFLGLLKPGSQSQLNKITWRDYFYENTVGYDKGSELLNTICKQTGKVKDIINMLKPIVDGCHTVELLNGCFSYFIRYFIEYNRNHIYSLRSIDRHMGSFLDVFDKTEVKTGLFTSYMQLEYKDKYKNADILVLLSGLYDAAINMPKVLGSYDNLAHRVLAIIALFYSRLNKLITKDKDRMKQLLINMRKRTERLISVSKELGLQFEDLSYLEKKEESRLDGIRGDVKSLIGRHHYNSKNVKTVLNKLVELDDNMSSQKERLHELKAVLKTNHQGVSELYNQINSVAQDYAKREKQLYDIALNTRKYLKERIEKLHEKIGKNQKKLKQFQEDCDTQTTLDSLEKKYESLLAKRDGINADIESLRKAFLGYSDDESVQAQEVGKNIEDLRDKDQSLQTEIGQLLANMQKHTIKKTSFKIETLQDELSKVQNLCDQFKVICDNETLQEDVVKLFNELEQKGLELKLSFENTQKKLVNETEQNAINLQSKVSGLKRSLENVDSGNLTISTKLKNLEKDVNKLFKYKKQKKELIEDMKETGEKIQVLAEKLDKDVAAAQYLNKKSIGFDLGALGEEDQNKVSAVLEVIKNYLSLSSGRKSPYFKKSARQKAKELSRRLKTYMENYSNPMERNLAWNDVETEMKRHRNSISGFFAKIFKIKTKSQKIYEQKFRNLQSCANISEKQEVGKIYEQNVELLKTFVQQEAVSGNGLSNISECEKGINGLFSRIKDVRDAIDFLRKDVDKYVAFVEGQKDIIQDFTEPQSVVEYLGKAFEGLCNMFNLQVPVILGTELNKRKNMMGKYRGNKQLAVEYAKTWLADIQTFLKKQEDKLNSYEKKLSQAKTKTDMFVAKVKDNKSAKSFFDEGLKLQYALHKVVENYSKRMDRTEQIFSLACNLYRGQLDKTQDFMTKVGKGNYEHHQQTRKDLQEVDKQRLHTSAKQLSKMGILGDDPNKQLDKLKQLLQEQKEEDCIGAFKWINNCFGKITVPTMICK